MKRFSIKGGVWRSNESLFRPTAVESNAVAVVSVNVPADGKLSPGVGDVSVITGGLLSLAVPASGGRRVVYGRPAVCCQRCLPPN